MTGGITSCGNAVSNQIILRLISTHPTSRDGKSCPDKLEQGQTDGAAAEPLVVGDPFFLRGQVPVVIREWGGFDFSDYGGPKDSESGAGIIAAFSASCSAAVLQSTYTLRQRMLKARATG
jgi:hypothetical protein